MIDRTNYILRGGRVIDPFRQIDRVMDIGIMDGVIVEPDAVLDPTELDLTGLVVAPGFIDLHVHLRQPGNTAAETIATGTRAAAAGGFTAIVPMPNTNPAADNSGQIEYLRRHIATDAVVKVHPCGCMTKSFAGEEMAPIGALKAAGVAALSDDGRCIQNHDLMRHVVEYARSFQLPILDHCEDNYLKGDGVMHEGKWSVLLGMNGMPGAAEELMVSRDAILARMTDWKIHLQHISTAESVNILRTARRNGIRLTGEVTPHHIALTDECIKRFDTNYKMNPPLRSEEDRQALLTGLADGTITVIATDHAPHTATAKLVEFDDAPFGIIGLETALPITLTELYHTGILSLSELIAKFTVGPCEVLGFEHNSLAVGNPADVTIFDPDCEYEIDADTFQSKSRNTPFHGRKVKGRAKATIVCGRLVYNNLA